MDFDTPDVISSRPCLLLVADPVLRQDALRVAAATDCVVQERNLPVGNDSAAQAAVGAIAMTRLDWDNAAAVLLDSQTAQHIPALRLPRRENVAVLARGEAGVEHWRTATAVGAAHVLELPRDEGELVRLLGTSYHDAHRHGGCIAVVGARGGAGASILSAALALVSAASEARTLLVDGDEFGGGMDLVLGWEDDPGLRWPGLVIEAGRISADSLHNALPSRGSLAVLSAGRVRPGASGGVDPVASAAVIEAGRRAGDLVVCDVPRLVGPRTEVFHDAADLVVVVVRAELGAVAAAENLAGYITTRNSNVGLVVRGPAPGGLTGAEIADALQLPLLASMRPEPGLAVRIERGGLALPRRSPLAAAARAVLDTFARKPQIGRAT